METVIAWVIGISVIGFLILVAIGTVASIFIDSSSEPDAEEIRRNKPKPRGGLGKVFLAGLLLGMWLDD